jgi:hypothetical protein
MDKNTIKKTLYKEQPKAYLYSVRKDGLLYTTGFGNDTMTFIVPLNEVGEVVWQREMEAKHLIRYLV